MCRPHPSQTGWFFVAQSPDGLPEPEILIKIGLNLASKGHKQL